MFKEREERNRIQPEDKGVKSCVFCNIKEGGERVLWSNIYRFITYNIYPCGGPARGEKHLLLIPFRHIIHSSNITNDERIARKEAEQWMYTYFSEKQFFSFIKHTDEIKSLQHIHYHYIAGTLYFEFLQKSIEKWDAKQNA